MPEEQAPVAPAAPAATPPAPKVTGRFEIPVDAPVRTTAKAAPEVPAAAASDAPAAQDTEDSATPAAPEANPDTPEAESKRNQRRLDRKIDKAYRQRAEAQARAEFLEKQLVEARAAQAPAKAAEGEPKLADFDYDPEKYAAAKAEYATKKAETELATKQRTAAQQAEHQRLVSAWDAKVDRAEGKYDDFTEVVGDLQPNSPFVAAIMEADNGEDIAYHLGKNPKEAERIAKLPPLSQIREIGKLEAKLAATPEKPKAPSKAPAPIAPLTGTTPAASASPSERDDMRDWMRKRQKQVHGRT